ncbi:hypothetical protein DSL64_06335 [Dyadobacter luteus]|jgi:hypothetical protein|uniref:Uncharacterized protein n=1 Tax=Dyadobacter luteus TaxID=2259619 RepID=A0A3D8YF28_9BACT|nr:hypothetical protein [Dyadobacter luteus]REA63229.1 hypothetical protein DSL64_06335 [Dyadobacter luteus]
MKVTTELIEKYNQGLCTPSEISAVEEWLLNDDDTDEIEISGASETQLKAEIWEDIAPILPSAKVAPVVVPFMQRYKWMAVAASVSVLIAVSATLFNSINKEIANQPALAEAGTKGIRAQQQEIFTEDFDIVLGDKSRASFDSDRGLVDFCGAIKISPKKDISLSFSDVCSKDGSSSKGIDFKKGETYFAMNYKNQDADQVVIMNENLIFELPPLLKYELSEQFDI